MMDGQAASLKGRFQAQYDLLENALSLGGSTAVTAVLGVVYWWVAARFLDATSVGYGSAAISAATLLATLGMAGYGSLLLGHVANSGAHTGSLIATGLAVAGGASLLLGIAYALITPAIAEHFAPYCASAVGAGLFVVATCLTSVTTVLDDALVGLFLGPVQLLRNIVFATAKLAILVVLALAIPDRSGGDVLASWSLGIVASILVAGVLLRRRGKRVGHSPRMHAFRRSAKSAMMHHWINLATVTPRLGVPILVTAVLSATENGWLYPAWIVATLAYVVPQHLSTSLFAVGAADRALLGAKTKASMKIAIAAGLPATLLLALLAHPLLSIFGTDYARHATVPMQWMMLAYVPNVIRLHYVTVLRVEGQLATAAAVMTGLGVIEIAAVVLGASAGGLTGMAAALAAVMWLEGFATGLPVIRAMRGDDPETLRAGGL